LVLCDSCCEEAKKNAALKTSAAAPKTRPKLQTEYQKYFCDRCNYSFRADKEKVGITCRLSCPYCGRGDHLHPQK